MEKGKVLSIDYGSKRVGFATGEADFRISFARGVYENEGMEDLIGKILSFCDEEDVRYIVVGFPLNFEGVENPIMTDVKKFVELLGEKTDIPVEVLDEEYSSFEADELMRNAEASGEKKLLGRDAYAAAVILQRFFDKKGN